MSASVIVQLPYPPSANRLWRYVNGRAIRSEEYRKWIKSAAWAVKEACLRTHDRKGIAGHYSLAISACPPDNRRRDIDNLLKPISDAIVKGGAVEDDHLCQRIEMRWYALVDGVQATVMSTTEIPAAAGCAGDGAGPAARSEPASSSPRAPGVLT